MNRLARDTLYRHDDPFVLRRWNRVLLSASPTFRDLDEAARELRAAAAAIQQPLHSVTMHHGTGTDAGYPSHTTAAALCDLSATFHHLANGARTAAIRARAALLLGDELRDRCVLAQVTGLTADQRAVLDFYFRDPRPSVEVIARSLGLSEANVRALASRGRLALEEHWS